VAASFTGAHPNSEAGWPPEKWDRHPAGPVLRSQWWEVFSEAFTTADRLAAAAPEGRSGAP